jgi:hypothetical protein
MRPRVALRVACVLLARNLQTVWRIWCAPSDTWWRKMISDRSVPVISTAAEALQTGTIRPLPVLNGSNAIIISYVFEPPDLQSVVRKLSERQLPRNLEQTLECVPTLSMIWCPCQS